MDQHFNAVAYLNFAYAALIVLTALIVGVVFSIFGSVPSGEIPSDVLSLLYSIGGIIAFILVVISLPYFLAGYGILKRYEWGRIMGIIVGALALLSFPLGTAIGAYAIWALTRPEAAEDFF
ncbi:MAG: hypothetical protein R3330_04885 [Saprospiraceae bacterium]|nr:hypothetical protein [Saprospiraceae bacterium]